MPSVPDVNLCQSSVSLFDDVCVRVNKAVVFADDGFAEILHWHGGVTSLLNAGVQDVREFNSFEVCSFVCQYLVLPSFQYKYFIVTSINNS